MFLFFGNTKFLAVSPLRFGFGPTYWLKQGAENMPRLTDWSFDMLLLLARYRSNDLESVGLC